MKWDEIKAIAEKRSKGSFHSWHYTTLREVPIEQQQLNGHFLATVANNFDKIAAVVEAAKKFQSLTHWGMSGSEVEYSHKLTRALEELDR